MSVRTPAFRAVRTTVRTLGCWALPIVVLLASMPAAVAVG